MAELSVYYKYLENGRPAMVVHRTRMDTLRERNILVIPDTDVAELDGYRYPGETDDVNRDKRLNTIATNIIKFFDLGEATPARKTSIMRHLLLSAEKLCKMNTVLIMPETVIGEICFDIDTDTGIKTVTAPLYDEECHIGAI